MEQTQFAELCGIDRSLRMLIDLYRTEHPSEKDIAKYFRAIEFEALRPEVSCMAAMMCSACDYTGVPQELIPRLRGIVKYVHTLNSGMTAGLCMLGKLWAQEGISVMLLRDTAVRLGYPGCSRRYMWQTTVSIPEKDYVRGVQMAANAGFKIEQRPTCAVARSGNTQCVSICKGMESCRATSTVTVGSTAFLMPGPPELTVSLAAEIFNTLTGSDTGARLIPWFMDLHGVIMASCNWNAVAAAAKQRKISARIRLALEVYNWLVPGALSAAELNLFATGEHASHLAQAIQKYRNLPPGKSLNRQWLSAKIKAPDALAPAWVILCKDLLCGGIRKVRYSKE